MVFTDRNGNPVTKPADRKIRKRTSAYGLYINDGKVLLVMPTWSKVYELPGGGIENNESPVEGLKREFFEETGCEITDLDEAAIKITKQNFYSDDFDQYYDSTLMFYRIKQISGQIRITHPEEIEIAKYISISELSSSNCKAQALKVIDKIRA